MGAPYSTLYNLQRFNDHVFQNCKCSPYERFYFEQLGIYEAVEDMEDPGWMPWSSGPVNEKLVLWGLARSGKWIAVWAGFDVHAQNAEGVHLGSTACVTSITFKDMSSMELIEELGKRKVCSPHGVLELLSREYIRWFEKYDERHSEAAKLDTIMRVEQALVTRIP